MSDIGRFELVACGLTRRFTGYVQAAEDPAPVPEYCPNRYRRGREFCSANAHWIPQGEIANGAGMGGAVGFGRTCFPAYVIPILLSVADVLTRSTR